MSADKSKTTKVTSTPTPRTKTNSASNSTPPKAPVTAKAESSARPTTPSSPTTARPPSRGSVSKDTSAKLPKAGSAVKGVSSRLHKNASDSGVEPILLDSEKDLPAEIDDIKTKLKDTTSDWSLRFNSLRRFEALILGGATNYPTFKEQLLYTKAALTKQVQDLRSQVAKEACVVLSLLAENMKDDYELFAEYFMPILLQLTSLTNKVISEAADQAVRIILTNVKLTKLLPPVLEFSKDKRNNILRANCTAYILLTLETAPTIDIVKMVDQIEEILPSLLTDAVSSSRANARLAFWEFTAHWKPRGKRLHDSLDQQTQQLLAKVKRSTVNPNLNPNLSRNGSPIQEEDDDEEEVKPAKKALASKPNGKPLPRVTSPTPKSKQNDDEDGTEENADEIKPASKKTTSTTKTITKTGTAKKLEVASEFEEPTSKAKPTTKKPKQHVDLEEEDPEEEQPKPKTKTTKKPLPQDEENDEEEQPKAKTPAKKKNPNLMKRMMTKSNLNPNLRVR